jgi:hypothetical protein
VLPAFFCGFRVKSRVGIIHGGQNMIGLRVTDPRSRNATLRVADSTSWKRRGFRVINFLTAHKASRPSASNVVLEASTNLAAWTAVQTNALPAFGPDLSMLVGTDQQQFFRARLAPQRAGDNSLVSNGTTIHWSPELTLRQLRGNLSPVPSLSNRCFDFRFMKNLRLPPPACNVASPPLITSVKFNRSKKNGGGTL